MTANRAPEWAVIQTRLAGVGAILFALGQDQDTPGHIRSALFVVQDTLCELAERLPADKSSPG